MYVQIHDQERTHPKNNESAGAGFQRERILNWYWHVMRKYEAHMLLTCAPLPILSLSRVDRFNCLSPWFSVLCEFWIELVLFQIAPHYVHPPQSGPSSRYLNSLPPSSLLLALQHSCLLFSLHGHTTKGVSERHICGDWHDIS